MGRSIILFRGEGCFPEGQEDRARLEPVHGLLAFQQLYGRFAGVNIIFEGEKSKLFLCSGTIWPFSRRCRTSYPKNRAYLKNLPSLINKMSNISRKRTTTMFHGVLLVQNDNDVAL